MACNNNENKTTKQVDRGTVALQRAPLLRVRAVEEHGDLLEAPPAQQAWNVSDTSVHAGGTTGSHAFLNP